MSLSLFMSVSLCVQCTVCCVLLCVVVGLCVLWLGCACCGWLVRVVVVAVDVAVCVFLLVWH